MLSHERHRPPVWENEDPEVFKSIFRQHYKPLCHYAYIILRDHTAAETAVRQAFADMLTDHTIPVNIKEHLYAAVHRCCHQPRTPAPLHPEMHKHVSGKSTLSGVESPLRLILAALRNKFHKT